MGGRVQLRGAWRQPQAPGPPAPRTLSCWAGAGAELSGLVSPLGRANPATGYFCGAPGLESGAGPPPRAARESPARKVRAPPAGTGPNPGPRPDLDPEPDPAPAASSGSVCGVLRTSPARSGRSPGTRPARGALLPPGALTHRRRRRRHPGSSGVQRASGRGCHRRPGGL